MTTKQERLPKPAPAAKRLILIQGAAAINKEIAAYGKAAAKMDVRLHILAVSCIVHSAQHNDPDTMTRMIDALGKSQRKSALVAWTLAYGAFKQDETGKLVYDKTRRDTVLSDENIKAAEAEPFWDFMPDPVYRQFDLNALLQRALKQAEAALARSEQDESLIPADKLAALRAIVAPAAPATVTE